MTLFVAIVGAGKLGQTHARHWNAVPGAQVIAVCDADILAAQSLASACGLDANTAAFTNLPGLLAKSSPAIVDICVPTPAHRELIETAAAAGCAVFVEKPLARTLADCDALCECVQRTGIPLMVGHVVRFFPAYAQARQIILNGGVGDVVTARLSRTAAFPARSAWYADPEQSGGVILDALLHDIDWLLWCLGPVEIVHAHALTFRPEHRGVRDYALVTLGMASGAAAHLTGSWAHAGPMRTTFEVCGTAGLLDFDSDKVSPLLFTSPGTRTIESPLDAAQDPFRAELCAFAESVRRGTMPPVTARDGRDAVRVALAALESVRSGQAVSLV